jgi:two-component system OmpR family response regulator
LSTKDSLETLRSMRRISGIAVILLAPPGSDVDVLQAFASGTDDYLPKPSNSEELVAPIKVVLALIRAAPHTTGAVRRAPVSPSAWYGNLFPFSPSGRPNGPL